MVAPPAGGERGETEKTRISAFNFEVNGPFFFFGKFETKLIDFRKRVMK